MGNQFSSKSFIQSQWHLLPLAGSSTADIQQKVNALTRYAQQYPQASLNEIASFLSKENTQGGFRKAVVADSTLSLAEQLRVNSVEKIAFSHAHQTPQIIFMFPGTGDHYLQMGRDLYERIPFFRETVDRCEQELRPFFDESLLEILYPAKPASPDLTSSTGGFDLAAMLGRKSSAEENPSSARLNETAVAHPLLFTIEYALAKLLQHWGIQPDGLIGYSLGEYVAATIAGVLTLKDALLLVSRRAQLIQALPKGSMLTAPLSPTDIAPYLSDQVSLSAHTGDTMTVLAGETNAILHIQSRLLKQGIACRVLDTSHAFHSHMMQAAAADLTELANSIDYAYPKIPYLSNVTGRWITAQQATDSAYWAQHMCQPVEYFGMLQQLLGSGDLYHLIEVGPGQSLGSFAKQHPQCQREQYTLTYPTMRYSYDSQDDHWFLLSTIRKLWLAGIDLRWKHISPEYLDAFPDTAAQLAIFASDDDSDQPEQQKARGEKRRQNRLRRSDKSRRRVVG